MGTCYQFDCPACQYSAEVSGGDDAGMEFLTTTIVCRDCQQLFDVPSGWTEPFAARKPPQIRCPKSKKHPITKWQAGGLCPKCGATMRKNDSTIVCWD